MKTTKNKIGVDSSPWKIVTYGGEELTVSYEKWDGETGKRIMVTVNRFSGLKEASFLGGKYLSRTDWFAVRV